MKILSLKARNINSLKGKTHIDFEALTKESALFAITGATGSGKSTLLDIISCALYGRTARLKNPNDLLSRHTGEGYCEVEFEVKNKRYRSSWSQRRARGKADGKFQTAKMELVDLEDNTIFDLKSKEVPKKVEELSGLDFTRFTQSMLLAQGGFDAFLKADEKERSALLEKMTGTQIYAHISMAVYQKYITLTQAIQLSQNMLDSIELLESDLLEAKKKDLEKTLTLKEKTHKQRILLDSAVFIHQEIRRKKESYVDLCTHLQTLQKEHKELFVKHLHVSKEFSEKTQHFEETMRVLKEARTLQTQRQEVLTTLQKMQEILNLKELQASKLTKTITEATNKCDTLFIDIHTQEHYLSKHQEDAKLIELWGLIDNGVKHYRLQKESYEKLLQEVATQKIELQTLTQKQIVFQKEFRMLQEHYKEQSILYKDYEEDKIPLLQKLQKSQNDLTLLQKDYKRYEELIEEKQALLKQQTQITQTLHNLKEQEKLLQEHLTTIKENLELLREQKAQKELLAKYEEDRKKLKEGEACFLCGATHHPYATHLPKTVFQENVLEQKQKLLKTKESEYQTILLELTTLQAKEQHLKERLETLEQTLQKFTHCQATDRFLLATQAQQLKKEIEEVQSYQRTRETLLQEKERLEKKIYTQEKQEQEHHLEYTQVSTQLTQTQEKLQQNQKELQKLAKELQSYGIESDNLQKSMQLLLEKKERFEKSTKSIQKYKEEYNKLLLELTEHTTQQELLTEEKKQLQEQIKQNSKREKALHVSQKELLNVTDLEHFEQEQKQSYTQAQNHLQKVEKNLTAIQEQLRAKSLHVSKLQQEIEENTTALQAVEKTLQRSYTQKELESLLMLVSQKEEALQELIGSIKKELEINEHNIQKFQKEKKKLHTQEQELALWTKLNELIGSSDGAKFKKFAQGITLDQLIYLANKHLEILSARYVLARSDEKLLELEIIDGYQGDVVRPIATLSGGESFIVSLALALGLSELASQKISIDSLFLDEGFGTLDAQSLEMALNALNLLQSGGKMVGVISHVEALKERIPLQIEVIPRGDGTSYVKVCET